MRRLRLIVPFAALLLVAAACANDDDGGGGGGDGATPATEENTGKVNVLNALSAEEGEALQTLVDEQINPEVEYVAEIEASDQFEEQFQIRAEGGTLDVTLTPQP